MKLLQTHSPLEDIAIFGCRHLCAIWNQQKAFVPQEISEVDLRFNYKKLMNQISDIIIRLKFLSVEILNWERAGFFTDVSTSITNTRVNEMYIIEQEAS
ncbi:hypothetical protein T12_12320 [Trichinella patagoniensis]|uniref:Uncharacterized protein n=1 Tax=Trichinella patagoniensis TaxID=990121 RepID=A0A0V0Z5I7_9BILA|nr:hypothetical protein T12_12320 [Trichinella patagoniensis]